jgi:hypothetical protein
MPTEIDAIPCAKMFSKFQDTIAYRLAIAKIAGFNPFE